MVGVTKIQRGNAGYWLAAVAEGGEDYYNKPGEAPGEWIGELAAELGLSGQVEAEAYSAILEGTDPTTGKQLVRRPDTKFRELIAEACSAPRASPGPCAPGQSRRSRGTR